MKEDSCDKRSTSISTSKRYEELVFIAIKHSFIVFMSVVASILTPSIIFMFDARPSWVTATEMLITQICLYLQFGFANNVYLGVCGPCHGFVAFKLMGARLTSMDSLSK